MYKILNSQGLGVAGRQNEIIELALTHGFSGVEIDIDDLVGRHDALGKEFACQFLQSAKIDLGTFCLPANLGGTEEEYQNSIEHLETILDLATTLNCKRCYINIEPTSNTLTFNENFDDHQKRLQEIGEALEPHGIKVGVALQASQVPGAEGEFKFIQTAEEILTLAKTVGQSNIGLFLDTWEWALGGGTADQLKELDLNSVLTEVRFADVAPDANRDEIKKNDRTLLPGDTSGSLSVEIAKVLIDGNYEGPVSVATSSATFANQPVHQVVGKLSKQLDILMAGDDPAALAAAAEAEAAAAAAESDETTDASDTSETVPPATEAKPVAEVEATS